MMQQEKFFPLRFLFMIAVLSDEDFRVINTCFVENNWRGAEICRQFSNVKVYEGRRLPFTDLKELQARIKRV